MPINVFAAYRNERSKAMPKTTGEPSGVGIRDPHDTRIPEARPAESTRSLALFPPASVKLRQSQNRRNTQREACGDREYLQNVVFAHCRNDRKRNRIRGNKAY